MMTKYSELGTLILCGGIFFVVVAFILFIVFLALSKGTGKRLVKQLEQEYRGY